MYIFKKETESDLELVNIVEEKQDIPEEQPCPQCKRPAKLQNITAEGAYYLCKKCHKRFFISKK